jgi:hypothetical protein
MVRLDNREDHLTTEAAKGLMSLAVESYRAKHNDEPPKELFIHGQTRFNRREWEGFASAADSKTTLVGVRIRDDKGLKLFRKTDNPILRGTAYINSDHQAFLWTRGGSRGSEHTQEWKCQTRFRSRSAKGKQTCQQFLATFLL